MRTGAVLASALLVAGCAAPTARPLPTNAPQLVVAPVVVPPARQPLAEMIATAPDLSRFRALAAAGGLEALVAGRGPVTILAPSDAAFARLSPSTVAALLLPGNRPSLLHLMRFWIVPAIATPPEGGSARLPTLDGGPVFATATRFGTTLTDGAGRSSTARYRPALEGMLFTLDSVIAPRSITPGVVATQYR